jgi:uncharacterized protein (DUF2267 family)
MTESIAEPTRLRIDCAECPLAPGLRFDLLDMQATVTLREAEAATSVWREAAATDATEMTVSSADDRLQIQRPRVVALRLPAGEPPEPGVYEVVAELTHDGATVHWPAEPRRVTFNE